MLGDEYPTKGAKFLGFSVSAKGGGGGGGEIYITPAPHCFQFVSWNVSQSKLLVFSFTEQGKKVI